MPVATCSNRNVSSANRTIEFTPSAGFVKLNESHDPFLVSKNARIELAVDSGIALNSRWNPRRGAFDFDRRCSRPFSKRVTSVRQVLSATYGLTVWGFHELSHVPDKIRLPAECE